MGLKKELSLFQTTLYGVGIIVGAGIYVLLGQGAGIAGNAIWISFAIAALIAAFTGLSYAELSSMFPRDAAEYIFTKKAFKSDVLAFLVQWAMIITLIISAATVALGFGGYFSSLFGVDPKYAAAGLIIIITVLNYKGIKTSAKYNNFSSILEVLGLVFVILLGIFFFGKNDIDYFASPTGLTGILSATTLIFFAYIGFEELVNLSEETKNASRVIPKALVLSLVISTVLYILVSLAAVAIVGSDALSKSKAPIADIVSAAVPGSTARLLMSFIALFSTSNTVLVILIVASRMLYGLSCNHELPGICKTTGTTGTPYISIIIVTITALISLLIGGIKTIASITDIGIFLVYLFVNFSLIRLRYSEPNLKREFKSPVNLGKFPLLALFGILTVFLMLYHFELKLLVFESVIIFAGILFYYGFAGVQKLKAHPSLFRKSAFTMNKNEPFKNKFKS
ncbi:amino acid permease [Candidatus Woesearchaeota archaeon]|nr:amino acid permease [Candidatus Woesearchaeota archaeon]